jgi:D-alanyl-D-alanine carboxypeptidase
MREIKARIILLRLPVPKIGLFTALMDGSGRNAVVRTKEKKRDLVYVIATPDTYERTLEVLNYIKRHIPELEILGEVSSEELDIG